MEDNQQKSEKIINELWELFIKETAKKIGVSIKTKEQKDRFIIALALTELLKK